MVLLHLYSCGSAYAEAFLRILHYIVKRDNCHIFLRPADASGDILSLLTSSSMLSGPETVARLTEYRLVSPARRMAGKPEKGFLHDIILSALTI